MKNKIKTKKLKKAFFTAKESEFLESLKNESGLSKADIIRKSVRLFKLDLNRKCLIIL